MDCMDDSMQSRASGRAEVQREDDHLGGWRESRASGWTEHMEYGE